MDRIANSTVTVHYHILNKCKQKTIKKKNNNTVDRNKDKIKYKNPFKRFLKRHV